MKLRLLSNLLLFCTSVALYASVPVVMTDSLPDSFDSEACEAVMQSSSACNQGAEAFSKFIAQFNSSLKFRAIRMKCDSRLQDFLLTPWWKTGRMYKLIPEKPARSNDYTLMTWTKVEADSVWMVGDICHPATTQTEESMPSISFAASPGNGILSMGSSRIMLREHHSDSAGN